MDYLRTLGSAAVSTLVQKSGLNLPFSLGQKLPQSESYYTLYDATKRDDGTPVSVFEYDFSDSSKKGIKPFALNSLKKLRTTRHPDILKFMDAVESETSIMIMTERIRPLTSVLPQYSNKSSQEKEDWLLWGLHRISVALAFLNDQCLSTHGRVSINSIFLTASGEWKLGGLELFSNPKDEGAVLYAMGNLLPGASSVAPPEVKKSGWSAVKSNDPSTADAYALGLLLYSTFNPSLPLHPTTDPPHPPPTLANSKSIPTALFPPFKKLLNPNPSGRLNAKGFLEIGMSPSGFFSNNRLVQVCSGLDNFALASEAEKNNLLKTLKESTNSFPSEFASYKVLPSLLSALEFGGASAATIIPLVLQFGTNLSSEDYSKLILTPIIKLYASPDRNTRMALLENLPSYADKLDKKLVSEKIFPHIQLGFSDTVPLIRESTLKSITLLAPKLTDRLLNNDLLRLLAKMQVDSEPSIRTNTCILLGRIGPSLGYNTKRKVLVPAFTRALKDSFVHARVAGLKAFTATVDCFEVPELATKVIPNMAFTLVDGEKIVRDEAIKAVQLFLQKLEEYMAQMPETAIVANGAASEGNSLQTSSAMVNTAAGTAGSLAGWAISSLGGMITTAETPAARPLGDVERTTSAPPSSSLDSHIGELKRPSLLAPSSSSPAIPNIRPMATTKTLHLGANRASEKSAFSALAGQIAEEELASASLEGNPWGSDDLMDVNADDDDWSTFESAPAKAPAFVQNHTAPAAIPPNPQRTQSPLSQLHPIQTRQSPKPSSDDYSWSDTPDTSAKPQTVIISSTPSSTMSKEDKAQEMARRKEERKQRIAMLKEQKKGPKS